MLVTGIQYDYDQQSTVDLPVRRIVYGMGDVDHVWRRVAVQAEPGCWCWDVSELDRVRIEFAKEKGQVTTCWERREPDVFWLLIRKVKV